MGFKGPVVLCMSFSQGLTCGWRILFICVFHEFFWESTVCCWRRDRGMCAETHTWGRADVFTRKPGSGFDQYSFYQYSDYCNLAFSLTVYRMLPKAFIKLLYYCICEVLVVNWKQGRFTQKVKKKKSDVSDHQENPLSISLVVKRKKTVCNFCSALWLKRECSIRKQFTMQPEALLFKTAEDASDHFSSPNVMEYFN